MHLLARTGFRRRFCAQVVGVFALIGVTGLAAAASDSAASAAPKAKVTAGSLIKASASAIAAQPSAHVVFDAANGSATAENIVGDVGTRGGSETVTDGTATLTVKVTPTDSYISGTSTGLTTLFGLTAAQATKVGTLWEFWKAGSAQYASLKKVVTVHSLLSLLPETKGTKLTKVGPDYTLTWTTKATAKEPALSNSLTISAKGAKLPEVETSTDAAGEKVTTTLSNWGESIKVQAPPSASTIAASAVAG
jgi:hypothetical protein